jgi:hypothetical protein
MAAVLKFPACASAGCNVPEAECLGHCMTTEKPLVKCVVRVGTGEDLHTYDGLFKSTCDAVIDAMERFGDATKIYVKEVTA